MDTPSVRRCLYVLNRLPWPLDDGWKRRAHAIGQGLTRMGSLELLCPLSPEEDTAAFESTFPPGTRFRYVRDYRPAHPVGAVLRSLIGPLSPLAARHLTETLVHSIGVACRDQVPDVVVYGGAFLAERHDVTPALRRIPFVLDTHNVDSMALERRAGLETGVGAALSRVRYRLAAAKQRRAERGLFRSARLVLTCSREDAAEVRRIHPDAVTAVVPNGVDIERFPPAPLRDREGPLRLLFFGQLTFEPNVDAIRYFCTSIAPALRALSVAYRLRIVGSGSTELMRRITQDQETIEVVGRVDDIAREIHAADGVIVPLRTGGGTRLKILEAMACQRPMVITTVAGEGIALTHEVDALITDDPTDFARAVQRVATDPELAESLAAQAVHTVRTRYAWPAVHAMLEAAMAPVVPAAAGHP